MQKLNLDEIKEIVLPIAKKYGVTKVAIFGSYARGEADRYSDVDLIINQGDIFGLWDFYGFKMDLEESLKRSVDLLTYDGLAGSSISNNILSSEVVLYEQ